MSAHPWFVIDTWGEHDPIGCWTEAAARRLPSEIASRIEWGRYKVVCAADHTEGGQG